LKPGDPDGPDVLAGELRLRSAGGRSPGDGLLQGSV